MTTTGTCVDKMEGRCQARHFLHVELDYPPEKNYEGVLRFVVLRVETPIMYWVRILGYWEKEHVLNYIKTIVSTARGVTAEVIVDYDKKVETMETPEPWFTLLQMMKQKLSLKLSRR